MFSRIVVGVRASARTTARLPALAWERAACARSAARPPGPRGPARRRAPRRPARPRCVRARSSRRRRFAPRQRAVGDVLDDRLPALDQTLQRGVLPAVAIRDARPRGGPRRRAYGDVDLALVALERAFVGLELAHAEVGQLGPERAGALRAQRLAVALLAAARRWTTSARPVPATFSVISPPRKSSIPSRTSIARSGSSPSRQEVVTPRRQVPRPRRPAWPRRCGRRPRSRP